MGKHRLSRRAAGLREGATEIFFAPLLVLFMSGPVACGRCSRSNRSGAVDLAAMSPRQTRSHVSRLLASGGGGEHLIDYEVADLDGDGRPEIVAITARGRAGDGRPEGGDILIVRPGASGLDVVHRHRRLNPWKLELGDVDGDGGRDIVVGVYKKSRYDPVMAKRPFVYAWDGKHLVPKWLGSRLSRRFDDLAVGEMDGRRGDELVALERDGAGNRRVAVYRWYSFGFDWVGATGWMNDLAAVESDGAGSMEVRHKGGRYSSVRVDDEEVRLSAGGSSKVEETDSGGSK